MKSALKIKPASSLCDCLSLSLSLCPRVSSVHCADCTHLTSIRSACVRSARCTQYAHDARARAREHSAKQCTAAPVCRCFPSLAASVFPAAGISSRKFASFVNTAGSRSAPPPPALADPSRVNGVPQSRRHRFAIIIVVLTAGNQTIYLVDLRSHRRRHEPRCWRLISRRHQSERGEHAAETCAGRRAVK